MGEDLLSDKVEHSGTAASRLMYWWFFEDLIGFLTWKRKGQIAKWPNVYLVSFENPRIEIVFTAHERVGNLISSTIPLTDAGSKRFFRLWMGLINRSRASYSDILSSFLPDGHDIMTKRTMLLISCKPLKLSFLIFQIESWQPDQSQGGVPPFQRLGHDPASDGYRAHQWCRHPLCYHCQYVPRSGWMAGTTRWQGILLVNLGDNWDNTGAPSSMMVILQ